MTCGNVKSFCLMNARPIYHTDHDTLDKISRAGLEAAVDSTRGAKVLTSRLWGG